MKPKTSRKGSTISSKNHRFQPFSERIVKLKIDPVRRRRNVEAQEEITEEDTTYFGKSVEEWKDLNLSQTFTAFAKDASPLCDSLPMVLYNEEKLVELLLSYIKKEDGLSMEPLLSLLSHLAHDLDHRFEKHFQTAVATILAVAARHQDPAVIEWSFTSLAWLFKYLSRVLAPDLRPLYDLMSPYLGKAPQKPFIVRFAAESLSFLVRKAAAIYQKDKTPLGLIIYHILDDCQNEEHTGSASLHAQGIMTLLTETMKGPQNSIHSQGLAIFQCMLQKLESQSNENQAAIMEITTGVLTSLIHHTTPETFQPIFGTILGHMENSATSGKVNGEDIWARILFTMVGSPKGCTCAGLDAGYRYARDIGAPGSKLH